MLPLPLLLSLFLGSFLIALTPASAAEECVLTPEMLISGSEPPPGACEGPSSRVAARRAAVAEAGPCGLSRTPFHVDGAAEGPGGATMCGECVPGTSYAEDGVCGLGEWCDDTGACQPLSLHPYFHAACPFELGAHTAHGFCGPGLRCVAHQCVECADGTVLASRGLRCAGDAFVRLGGPGEGAPSAS